MIYEYLPNVRTNRLGLDEGTGRNKGMKMTDISKIEILGTQTLELSKVQNFSRDNSETGTSQITKLRC
jgi:hypothetical protein